MTKLELPAKPLGRKAYGSIPHLPGSRLGPGDWSIEPVQAALLIEAHRWNQRHRDRVIVTEKLDGSCVAIGRLADRVVALNRAGYDCFTSPHVVHRGFARWVAAHESIFMDALKVGERTVGEWLQIAHGTRYDIHRDMDLFVPFDLVEPGRDRGIPERRLPHDEMHERVRAMGLRPANVLHDGGAIPTGVALERLGERGAHGAIETAEGVVYRIETNGAFNYLAKLVRPGKVDGKYLAGLASTSATEETFNGPAAERWAV